MNYYGFKNKAFQSRGKKTLISILLLLTVFAWVLLFLPASGGLIDTSINESLRIDFINVGQGDSILVRTPEGRNYLIDGGMEATILDANKTGRELVQNYLNTMGVKSLDGVIISHWHNDHFGGLLPVIKTFPVKQTWECGTNSEVANYKKYEELCKLKRIKRVTAKSGDVLEWGNEIFVQVINPELYSKTSNYSSLHNSSIVLLIRYGKVQVLLAGDIEEDSERELMKYGEGLRSQILKIPNHGSDASIYEPFLKLVRPKVGIICVGKDNPFRHPAKDALKAYKRLKTKIYRTDESGSISLVIGGKSNNDFKVVLERNP